MLSAFKEEIGGGAKGIVQAVLKFGNSSSIRPNWILLSIQATWFAQVDVSDDKQISRQELFQFMKESIKGINEQIRLD